MSREQVNLEWEYRTPPYLKKDRKSERLENLLESSVYNLLFVKLNPEDYVGGVASLTGYSEEIVEKYLSRLQKRFLKGNIGKNTYEMLNSAILEKDANKSRKLFEELMKMEFKALRKISKIERHDSSEGTWRGMDRLGLDYFEEVRKGYDSPYNDERWTKLTERSERQIEIANEVVLRSIKYVRKIIDDFLYKGNIYSPHRRKVELDGDENEIFRVAGTFLDDKAIELGDRNELREELINHVSHKLIENMHNYKPEAYSMSTFIRRTTEGLIIRFIEDNISLVRVPNYLHSRVRKIISESDSREYAVGKIKDLIVKKYTETQFLFPNLVYDAFRENFLSLEDVYEIEIKAAAEGTKTFNERFLTLEELAVLPHYEIDSDVDSSADIENLARVVYNLVEECGGFGKEKYQDRNKKILKELFSVDLETDTIREGDIFPMGKLSSVGREFGISETRVKQIVNRFMRSIKHPSRKKILRELSYTLYGRNVLKD